MPSDGAGGERVLLGLYRFLMGYLDVEITGRHPERLVNGAAAAAMDLWDLAWRGGSVAGRMQLRDFRAIRPLARQARCRVRVRGRHGLPFLLGRLRRRRALLGGAAACLGVLLWFTSHIWVVEVRGTEYLDPRAVRHALAGLGLRPGVWKPRLSIGAVQRDLPYALPEVAWAAVRLQGTRAVVEVVERRVEPEPPANRRVDIVAARPCRVEEVVVMAGHPRVQAGTQVEAGQTLIEGGVYIRSAPAPVLPGHPRPEPDRRLRDTVARGRVRGLCRYTDEVEIPLWQETRTPGPRTVRRLTLRVAGREFRLLGPAAPPFPHYRAHGWTIRVPGWRNRPPTVELQWVKVQEEIVTRTALSLEAARQAARERLLARLAWRLEAHDRIHAVETEVVEAGADRVRIRTVAETIEDIGQPVPVAAGGPP